MGAKIIYEPNSIIGEYGVIYLSDIEGEKPRKANFICPICGSEFISTIDGVKRGHCKSCGCLQKIKAAETCHKKKKDLKGYVFGKLTVLEQADSRQNNNRIRGYWKCQCECGSIIEVETSNLTTGHTQSCGCVKSRGEEKIATILTNNNILFEKEKYFTSYHDMRFDFYLPEYNCCIEYDGSQHFNDAHGNWNNENMLKENKKKDKKKNQWCKDNNICLIRIPYTFLNNITIEDLKPKTSKFILDWREK